MDAVRWLVRQQAGLGEAKKALEEARRQDPAMWQETFVAKVALDAETLQWPRPRKYVRRFLQHAVSLAEDDEDGVQDELAECLAEAIANDVSGDADPWSWFSIGPARCESVTCRVRVNDAGMNKVGHLPWEAGLMLAEWAMRRPDLFRGKHVLELGAGTGLTGLAIARDLAPKSIVLTDFGQSELENLSASVAANNLDGPAMSLDAVRVAPFDWFNAKSEAAGLCTPHQFDTLIAADCVYDPALLDCFLDALAAIFAQCPYVEAYVLSTQRNQETFDNFVHEICLDTSVSVVEITAELGAGSPRGDALCYFGPSAILLYGAAGANLGAMRLLRITRSAPSQVPVKTAALVSNDEFARAFMAGNTPCMLRGVDLYSMSRADLAADDALGRELVPVADASCPLCNPDKADRVEQTLHDYLHCWDEHPGGPGYLKDWHWAAARERLDGAPPIEVPRWFRNDWLNEFCERGDLNESDYRFLYLGPAGSCTLLHHDVYLSYSWSFNVRGTKLWILFPENGQPRTSSPVRIIEDKDALLAWFTNARAAARGSAPEPDASLRNLVEKGLASCANSAAEGRTAPLLAVQGPGDSIFVPSGWYHEVHNLEETLSLNTNWFNEHNLARVNQFLLEEQAATQEALADCRETTSSEDEFDELVQRVMGLNAGINRSKWTELLKDRARRSPRDVDAVGAALAAWAGA